MSRNAGLRWKQVIDWGTSAGNSPKMKKRTGLYGIHISRKCEPICCGCCGNVRGIPTLTWTYNMCQNIGNTPRCPPTPFLIISPIPLRRLIQTSERPPLTVKTTAWQSLHILDGCIQLESLKKTSAPYAFHQLKHVRFICLTPARDVCSRLGKRAIHTV